MAVNKTLEIVYDLSSLNQEQAQKLIKANVDVIKQIQKQKKKTQKSKQTKKQDKQQDKRFKDFIKNNSQNLSGFIFSTLKTSLPALSAIIGLTAIITSMLKQLNDIQIKFTEDVDDRINISLSNQEQARVDANLQQIIITNGDGSINPRNAYNSLNESDANVSFIESTYRLENTSGYD